METDYISREAVLARAKTLHETQFGTGTRTLVDVSAVRVSDIEDIPAADVRPVKEGHWTDGAGNHVPWDEMNPGCPAISAYCSVCGEWLTASDEYPAIGKYCPNCGVRMGGQP